MSLRLKDKVAIITGASGGIGKAVALSYLNQGAKVVLTDINNNSDKAFEEFFQNGKSINILGDISDRKIIEEVVSKTLIQFDKIDILFNCAAIFNMAPFLEESYGIYKNIFKVNVEAMWLMMQAVALEMKKNKNGSIINLASQAGTRGEPLNSHYCASKASVISYTESAALALAQYNIRVNCIAPGVIDTPMWEEVDKLYAKYENLKIGEKKQGIGRKVPLGYMGSPKDITGLAVFLASDESRYITAGTHKVDGGGVWV